MTIELFHKLLLEKSMDSYERSSFIKINGANIRHEIKVSFQNGKPCIGMSRELIFTMYGFPNESKGEGDVWIYTKDGVSGTLFFTNDTISDLSGAFKFLSVQ